MEKNIENVEIKSGGVWSSELWNQNLKLSKQNLKFMKIPKKWKIQVKSENALNLITIKNCFKYC